MNEMPARLLRIVVTLAVAVGAIVVAIATLSVDEWLKEAGDMGQFLESEMVQRSYGEAFEPAAVYLCISILLILAGPGRFSVDRFVFGEKA
jgi:uncharacterized membrane protein YphA (DoxX/SURF4 family)